MSVIKSILLLAIIKSVISDKALKLDPCGVQDIECLSKSTEQFLESTSAGIPAYDIKQIDPIVISEVSYKDPGSDILFHFKNIKVTGMKDQKMYDFKMDTQEKSVVLQTRIKADILTDVDVELTEASKNISGSYNIKASVIATAAYNYDLKPNDVGVEYFEVGPETITCVVEGDPEVTLDPKFAEAISKVAPLPFPACRADDIDCLRRGIRTFFFLMDTGLVNMQSVDPAIVNSVAVSLPEEQMSLLLRRSNVTGARWTRLVNRRFDIDGKSSTTFSSDLHIAGELNMNIGGRVDPLVAYITMDIQDVESNITYPWRGTQGIDKEDYILIGPERIAVRNSRTPTYFLQPKTEDAATIDSILQAKPSILEHLSNEIIAALMHSIVDNFRLFASKVSVRHYYKYY